jgi:hypothetical protein
MILILCPNCGDIVKLYSEARTCLCGKSSGWYVDDIAIIDGDAIPIGISNVSLERAVRLRPANGRGEGFDAWVLPDKSDSARRYNID